MTVAILVFNTITRSVPLLMDYWSPRVSISVLTWFIVYIYHWILLLLNNAIINATNLLVPRTFPTLVDYGHSVYALCGLLASKDF